jgi:hypothetical protein
MSVPYTFATQTSSIPLSELDANFATAITLGGTNIYLGNTTTTITGLTLTGSTFTGNVTSSSVAVTGGTIDGTAIGSTTPAAGAFTTLSASSTVSGSGFSTYLASPPAIGGTAAAAGSFTTLSSSGTSTLNTLHLTNVLGTTYGGTGLSSFTANGVVYASSTSALTTGSALTFDGTNLGAAGNGVFNTGAAGYISSGSSTYSGYLGLLGGSSGAILTITPSTTSGANGVTYNTSFVSGGSGPHIFSIGGSEGMRLTSTGLGIGTSSPAYKLDVTDNTTGQQGRFSSSSSNGTSIAFTNTATNGRTYRIGTNFAVGNGEFTIYDSTAGASRLTIDSSGRLLVGLTSAVSTNADLQVNAPINFKGYTVAGLPTGTTGDRAYVTNALSPVFGATVVGGGSVVVPVFYNGSNWIVG